MPSIPRSDRSMMFVVVLIPHRHHIAVATWHSIGVTVAPRLAIPQPYSCHPIPIRSTFHCHCDGWMDEFVVLVLLVDVVVVVVATRNVGPPVQFATEWDGSVRFER